MLKQLLIVSNINTYVSFDAIMVVHTKIFSVEIYCFFIKKNKISHQSILSVNIRKIKYFEG